MLWWILIALASAFVVRHLWRSYSHPYNMLVRQPEQFIAYFNKLSDDAASSLVPRIAAFD